MLLKVKVGEAGAPLAQRTAYAGINVPSLSKAGWRAAISKTNRARIVCRDIGRADHTCWCATVAIANTPRVGDFLRDLAYDRLILLLPGHDLLLSKLDRQKTDLAPVMRRRVCH
ncbi:MAG: hypothetical protein ACREVD_15965 [Burkholderiales bacterium]